MADISIVLLPGMDGTGLLFGPLLRNLGGDVKAVAVSYPPTTPLSYEELLPLVRSVLPREAPYVLLGESFSGPLAVMLAAERPPNLKALLLAATFIRNPIRWIPGRAGALATPAIFRLSKPFVLAKALMSGHGSRNLMALINEAHSRVAPAVMAARARAILSVNVEAELKAVRAPIFLLRGASDMVVPRTISQEIEKARPNVRSFQIPGPHLVLQANPDQSASVIRQIVEMVK